MGEQAELRRREATRAVVRYFALGFAVVCLLTGIAVYAILDARADARASLEVRTEYCRELEKLKTQNREDVAEAKEKYAENLRLLGIKDTPELRKAVEASWAKKLRRNAAKPCPYTPS